MVVLYKLLLGRRSFYFCTIVSWPRDIPAEKPMTTALSQNRNLRVVLLYNQQNKLKAKREDDPKYE